MTSPLSHRDDHDAEGCLYVEPSRSTDYLITDADTSTSRGCVDSRLLFPVGDGSSLDAVDVYGGTPSAGGGVDLRWEAQLPSSMRLSRQHRSRWHSNPAPFKPARADQLASRRPSIRSAPVLTAGQYIFCREPEAPTSPGHIVPAAIVAALSQHVAGMRETFFEGRLPEIVLSFDVTDRRSRGHCSLRRDGLGVRWVVNLNPVHLARPLFEVLATILHELSHVWQEEKGTASRSRHHNREFIEKCQQLGIPTNRRGHYLGVRSGSPFEDYCKARGVPVPTGEASRGPALLLAVPPATPKGSRLRKWICACEHPVPVRVARSGFDATCNKCGKRYRLA